MPLPFWSDQLARFAYCMRKVMETMIVSLECLDIQPAEAAGNFSIVRALPNAMYFALQAKAVQPAAPGFFSFARQTGEASGGAFRWSTAAFAALLPARSICSCAKRSLVDE